MLKSELIEHISAQNPALRKNDVEKIVNAMLDAITAAMARADRVELRGFGAFSVRKRAACTGRNPRTQAHVSVEEKSVPYFKTGKATPRHINHRRGIHHDSSSPTRQHLSNPSGFTESVG
jgi:integration host factor subunit beta